MVKKGRKMYRGCPGAWKNYTVLKVIGLNKIVEGILINGILDKSTFKYFMEDLLLPLLLKGSIVGMDTLSVHTYSFDMTLCMQKKIATSSMLPYSPDLNPIEKMWNKVKGPIRKMNPRNFNEIWHDINVAFWEITPDNLPGFYRNCGYFH